MKHKTAWIISLIAIPFLAAANVLHAQRGTGKNISVPDIDESDLKPFILKHEGAFLRSVQNNGHIQELISRDYNTSFRFDQEEHLQYSAKIFLEKIKKYPGTIVMPPANILMISFPENIESLFHTSKNRTMNHQSVSSEIVRSIRISDNQKEKNCSVVFQINESGKHALCKNIVDTYYDYQRSSRINTWSNARIPQKKTPFHFNAYFDTSFHGSYVLEATYYNMTINVKADSSDSDTIESIQSIFDSIVKVFHGYKTIKNVPNVDYYNLTPTVKDDSHHTTTFKLNCIVKEQHNGIPQKNWVLAVSDKGELSVDKFSSHLTPKNETIEYSSSIPNPFDTVFLTLPLGEKSATLTFYFISEDGKQYSAQSITLSVPEKQPEEKQHETPSISDRSVVCLCAGRVCRFYTGRRCSDGSCSFIPCGHGNLQRTYLRRAERPGRAPREDS